MAALAEVDSFIVKYKQLWKKGCDATLTLKSVAGKASISLNLNLDVLPGPELIQQEQTDITFKHTSTNSRDRRRKRRESQHKEQLAVDKTEFISDDDNACSDSGFKTVVIQDAHVTKSEIAVGNKDVMDEIISQDGTVSCTEDIQAEKAYDDSQKKSKR